MKLSVMRLSGAQLFVLGSTKRGLSLGERLMLVSNITTQNKIKVLISFGLLTLYHLSKYGAVNPDHKIIHLHILS